MKLFRSSTNQSGIAHLGIILAVVGVVTIGGLIAWRYLGATSSTSTNDSIAQQLASAKCEYDDKDLCKFFVSWKAHTQYKMVSSTTDKSTGETSIMTYEIDGDNTHSIMTGAYASEIISIGKNTTYTKAANGTWWKQTTQETTPTDVDNSTPDVDFEEPADSDAPEATQPTYKSLGKEACDSLTCFKYQVVYPDNTEQTEFLWFDDKSYQLRHTVNEDASSKSDTKFSYDNVTVKAPSNFKELGPNQYLMPGENEPTTMPTAADYEQ